MKFIISLFLLIPTLFIAQKITIKGYAVDSTKGRNRVSVSINDSVDKIYRNEESNMLNYGDLSELEQKMFHSKMKFMKFIIKEKKAYRIAKRSGKFKIIASLKDSLTFNCQQCVPQTYAVSDLKDKKVQVFLKKIDCNSIPKCTIPTNLNLIVASRKSLKIATPKNYCDTKIYLDAVALEGKYNILKNYSSNRLPNPIIFSVVSPRNGSFKQYNNLLLLLREDCNDFTFYKNQFFPAFKTKVNEWAVGVDYYTYSYFQSKSQIKPHPIDFDENEFIDLSLINSWDLPEFKEPYYKVENNKAYPKYGFTIEEAKAILEEMK